MNPSPIATLPPDGIELPEPLCRLTDLAYNAWWTWHRAARELFGAIDRETWSRYQNPVRLLLLTRRSRWQELADDAAFLERLARVVARFDEDTTPVSWDGGVVAYVSAEYALTESLPLYSGGLGVLSGDHLKAASDLALPLIAAGLFYRRAYFRQLVDVSGDQQHWYPDLDERRHPLLRAAGRDGGQLAVEIELAERTVVANVWIVMVGRIPLVLLDTDNDANPAEDRHLTAQLYPRGRALRLEQELVLGRGTVAALAALGIEPSVFHMNEGHSAFLAIERMRRRGGPLDEALGACRAQHVFTTHTPVAAGNEVFEVDAVRPYLTRSAQELGTTVDALLALGKAKDRGFNLTALALGVSSASNGVSTLHGRVSRQMWPGHEIGAITNGIHVATWLGRELAEALGADERTSPDELSRRAAALDDDVLWRAHLAQKDRLMRFVRLRTLRQAARHGQAPADLRRIEKMLAPGALTFGFGRRFARYKRADLLFLDPPRLQRLLTDPERPVQLVIAGKAHPADREGQEIIRRIWGLASTTEMHGRVVFIEDYDMAVARLMVRGVDAWLNTPEWPREASGTSGMKAAANGVLNASVPDGWWAEAADDELGFTIGEARAPDPGRDNDALLALIEGRIVPLYYDRDGAGLPRAWIAMMRRSMAAFIGRFSARRMVEEYATTMYGLGVPSA